MAEETHFRILRLLEANPKITQRELAEQLGISLGKVNYCLKALADKGWVKARNFSQSPNKRAYLYVLTPRGLDEKARITVDFLRRKLEEYEDLKREIAELKREAGAIKVASETVDP